MTGTAVPTLHYRAGAGGIVVNLDALVRGRGLIQANSGGGKSWALRQVLEETFGQVQHLVIDPEGEFATLRERFDYVLAAKHGGDVEASPRTAKMLCRRLMETSASAVLDLYDLKPNERREFARLFLTELLALPKDLRRPLLVVLDEAHTFAPEGAHSEAAEAVVTLAAQGRKRGYALICATQRLSKLSKDVAAELNTKLIGRTGLDLDVKRAGDELGMDKEHRQSLATLEPGTFWAYGPALPAGPPRLVRTGMVATSHPEVGELAAPAPPPSRKVKALLAASLADLPKEAEEEARSLDDLKRQNSELQRKLRTAERAQGTPTERVITKPVIDQAAIDRAVHATIAKRGAAAGRALDRVVGPLNRMKDLLGTAIDGLEGVRAAWQNGDASVALQVAPSTVPATVATPVAAAPRRAPVEAKPPAEGLTTAQQKILNALAQLEQFGIAPASTTQAAIFAGYTEGGHFDNTRGSLRSAGLVEYPSGGMIQLTEEGRAVADAGEGFASLAELHAFVFAKLSESHAKILRPLMDVYPESLSVAELSAQSGYSGGHFDNMRGRLRTMGYIEYPKPGYARASDLLYPAGLR